MNSGCQENQVIVPEWASALIEAIPMPAAVMTPDGRVLYANSRLRLIMPDGSSRAAPDGTAYGQSNHLLDRFQGLRQLLDGAVRAGGADGEVRIVACGDGSCPALQAHAGVLPAASDGCSLVLVTWEYAGAADTLRRRLEDCEYRYRELLQASTDLIFVLDSDGTLFFVNRTWQQHMGYTLDEILGTDGLSLIYPEFQRACRAAMGRAASGQYVENLEFRSSTKGGGHVDVLVNLAPIRNDRGQVVQIMGAGRDITEFKRAQEELRSSEERLRILFEYAPDAYYLNDLKGTFLDGNRAAEEMCGYKREELIGQNFLKLKLLPRNQLPRAAAHLAKNALGRRTGPTEFCLNRKDGTQVQVETRTYPVQIGGQTVVLGIARDISERKKAEEAIWESEEKFKVIFEEAYEGIAYLDDAGHVLEVNKRTVEISGQPREQIVGRHFTELGVFDPADIPQLLESFERMMSGGLEPVTLWITNRQGRRLCVEWSGSLVRHKDGSRGVTILIRDITECKRAEELLEALNRDLKVTINDLERSNQELRDFAHVAAHDLKAPLRGIATLADWISRDYEDRIDEQGQENLKLLRQRVERMSLLINGILRYAEIGHGDRSVESIDTNAVVAEVIEQIAAPQHITIRIDGPLPVVSCERVPLTQVFLNLISNAVKYMDKPRGEIRITAVEEGDFWRFSVIDNGMGIEERYFDRLFQMFQTLVPSNHGESTGIGLAVVKKIVQMHGGCVGVESKPGRGSTFSFTLPREKEGTMYEKH